MQYSWHNSLNTSVRKEDDSSVPCKLIAPRKQVEIRQMTTAEKSNGRHTQTLILTLRVFSLPNRDHVTKTWLSYTNKATHIAGADKVWGYPTQKQNHSSTMVVTQSHNVLICLFVRVVVNVVVWLYYQRFEVSKARAAQEIVSQFYSGVKGSNSVLR